jgi:hypothetical protein
VAKSQGIGCFAVVRVDEKPGSHEKSSTEDCNEDSGCIPSDEEQEPSIHRQAI